MIADAQRRRGVSLTLALAVFGLACLLSYGITTFIAWDYQQRAKAELQRELDARQAELSTMPQRGELIGRVDIPRLRVSAAVAEGDDDKTLDKAVGHLPDTPLPWHGRGNVALAAHRDGLFRRLENIQLNDEVRFATRRGDYFYRVKRTRIVDPNDVWVIQQTAIPTITLITCYPFSFVGNAPQRFIVQAELVGHVAGSALSGSVQQPETKKTPK